MPSYRVKPGYIFGAANQYKAGAVVELTDKEAAGFLDKLEKVDDAQAEPDTLNTSIRTGGSTAAPATDNAAVEALRARVAELEAKLQALSLSESDVSQIAEEWLRRLQSAEQGNIRTGGLVVSPATVDESAVPDEAVGNVTVETVEEKPLETTETVEVVETDAFDVNDATVDEVLAAVKEGKITADAALLAEQQGKRRVSLIEKLTGLAGSNEVGNKE